jgi:hypothetical protein
MVDCLPVLACSNSPPVLNGLDDDILGRLAVRMSIRQFFPDADLSPSRPPRSFRPFRFISGVAVGTGSWETVRVRPENLPSELFL